ncbi:MAG: ATP-dependent sacrificial sulfur transferase LarE [Bacillota bacterium]|uniref:ATP-dependent sacrificial sulfur transferase LarE n=1 Tax=unclassified Carboxydocella TaxID=2685367 RepID=UPI0009D5CF39|nr:MULTISPECIES: ATP-dependent sacrificial sulfur transferase LarE [unclassified Carboxydocella]GAW28068.1 adenine nucleotide alpha hydrolase [Carboxydocella sp. ULO1]GAW32536.1 adenine nucleotide alpha hydrolase [Carboxydocella sp. JDF658]
MQAKLKRLQQILKENGSCLIAFSGGVDSTFLLQAALKTLGPDQVLAVTAFSETYPERERQAAVQLARQLGARLLTVETEELADPEFVANPIDRCYICKKELWHKLQSIQQQYQLQVIYDGANADDASDFRPGRRATREAGVISPLLEAGLTKEEIRQLSREWQLPTWNKPSFACLSSRFPYGSPITREKLLQIDAGENWLIEQGFLPCRVRHHGEIARLELAPDQLARLVTDENLRQQCLEKFKSLGFTYITLDLQGFRSGSMNENLSEEVKNGYK